MSGSLGSHGQGRRIVGRTPKELVEAGTANREVVLDLLEELRKAWEKILNDYAESHDLKTERGGVKYVDAWMAGHNFFKLVMDNIVDEAGLQGEAAAQLYLGAGTTFKQAMEFRALQKRKTV